ncbi:MAG TPA: ABC transporter permease [Terracidiphilus sp.]|nr:ABC transporter permease [Terracidiphilus sp.]
MKFLSRLLTFRKSELSDEIEAHLRMAVQDRVDRGESPHAARQAALREFGNVMLVRDVTREQWGWLRVGRLRQDVCYAFRQLKKYPFFAAIAILMLALGIGANTAVFSVFNQVLLQSLPVQNPNQLVVVSEKSAAEEGSLSSWGDNSLYFSYPAYLSLRDGTHTLQGLSATAFDSVTLTTGDTAENIIAEFVAGNYFNVLGVRPILGRAITPADDIYHKGNPVAVVSKTYWKSHFGGDPAILNRIVRLNGKLFTIVGVVNYRGLTNQYIPALFVPIATQNQMIPGSDRLPDELWRWITLIGRRKADVTQQQAEAELNGIWLDWRRAVLAKKHRGGDFEERWMQTHLSLSSGARGLPFLESLLGEPVRVLLWMVFVVLVIACGNLAILLSVKAVRRRRELALQGALGASRGQLFRQVFVEGMMLGLIGYVAGLILAAISLRVILGMIPTSSTLRDALTFQMDWQVLAFAGVSGVVTSVLFSVAPALSSMKIDLIESLHSEGNATTARSGFRNVLIAGEIALSVVLLTCAGLFAWTLYQLRSIDPGYSTTHLVMFSVDASVLGKHVGQVRNEYEAIVDRLRRLPEVSGVSYSSMALLSGDQSGSNIVISGYSAQPNEEIVPDFNWITPDFLGTMQIPLLAGRNFTPQDRTGSEKVAMVDEEFVKRYYGGQVGAALGRLVGFGGSSKPDTQIVGVVPVLRSVNLQGNPGAPFLYIPYDQIWEMRHSYPATFYVRTSGKPKDLTARIRSGVMNVDHSLPIEGLQTMQDQVDSSLFEQRLMATLAVTMAGLALFLSAVGLYGVLAFSVTQRTREMGIRIALGADKGKLARLVLLRLAALAGFGIAAGIPLAWAGMRLLIRTANVSGSAVWMFTGSAILLLLVCGVAGFLPVRRAMSMDPMRALRAE